jgi:hypothetical protein
MTFELEEPVSYELRDTPLVDCFFREPLLCIGISASVGARHGTNLSTSGSG